MTKCRICGKTVSFKERIGSLGSSLFYECKDCKKKGEKKLGIGSEEKKDQTRLMIGVIICGVLAYFIYSWFIDPFCSLFGLSKGWKIGIGISVFLIGVGFLSVMQNTVGFFEKANKKLSKENTVYTKTELSPEDKLMKLKELKNSGAITEKEFKTKKQKLLKEI